MESESRMAVARARLGKLAQEAVTTRMAGFAMSQAWVYVVLFSNSLTPNAAASEAAHSPFYIASLAVLVLTLMCAGIAPRLTERLSRSSFGQWGAGTLCALGTILLPFCTANLRGITLLACAGITTGIGSGLLLTFWGKSYRACGGPATAGEAAVAFAVASLVQPFLVYCPVYLRVAAGAALALGSSALLHATFMQEDQDAVEYELTATALSTNTSTDASMNADLIQEGVNQAADAGRVTHAWHTTNENLTAGTGASGSAGAAVEGARSIFESVGGSAFVKLMASSIILGACTSIMQGFFPSIDPVSHDAMYAIAMPLASIASSALLIGTLAFSSHLDIAFTYQTIPLIVILGCFALLFMDQNNVVACALVLASHQYFGLLNWVLLATFTYGLNAPPMRIFGLGRGSLSGGVFIGHLALTASGSLSTCPFETKTALLLGVVFAVAIACTLVFTPRTLAQTLRKYWLQLPPRGARLDAALDESEVELTLDDKILFVAREYEITGRSLEVLTLLAHGRTGTRIQQELYMSEGTVKTHTRRIYQKLGVHSKQEMLDLIESASRTD